MLLPDHAREILLGGLVVACGSLAAAVTGGDARAPAASVASPVPTTALAEALAFRRVAVDAYPAPRAPAPVTATRPGAESQSEADLLRHLVRRVEEDPDGWTDLVDVLRRADRFAPDDAHGLALPEVALQLLARCSRERPVAREALEALVWGDSPIPVAPLRRRAAAAFAAQAVGPELGRLASHLRREHDQGLDAAVRAALTTHPDSERVREVFPDLPIAIPGEER